MVNEGIGCHYHGYGQLEAPKMVGWEYRALSPVQTIKSILSFHTFSMYLNVAFIRENGESHGPSGTAK